MTVRTYLGRTLAAAGLALIVVTGVVEAQQKSDKPFEPYSGQPGKDVVWVPTPQATVDRMLDTAKVAAGDILYDLGSGDGRTVITAAKRGATAFGIEYNIKMVELARKNAEAAGVTAKATFAKADLFRTDFSKATVVTMFLLPEINLRLRPKILNMRPGTRIVSNSFTMGDWQPDESSDVKQGCQTWCTVLYWVVPAKVGGNWRLGDSVVSFKQSYQMVTGSVRTGKTRTPITSGRITGDKITFTAGGTEYTATIAGRKMNGTSKSGTTETPFTATRG